MSPSICVTVADSQPSSPTSSLPIVHSSASSTPDTLSMKDLPASTARHVRNQLYPKKRPSPHRDGITKSRAKDSPPTSSARRTPAIIKAELMRQRRREAQLIAYRREGIYVEEEYREDICYYMHEMEVRFWNHLLGLCVQLMSVARSCRGTR
jgi:hypothetical protein